MSTMIAWRPATPEEAVSPVTRIGGYPTFLSRARWPVCEGRQIPFWGQIATEQEIILVFLGDLFSYEPENGDNAALVEPLGEVPAWVDTVPLRQGPSVSTATLVPTSGLVLGGRPRWLQQDDTPAAAPCFVCQIDTERELSDWPPLDNFGWMYLFTSPDRRQARVLWQS